MILKDIAPDTKQEAGDRRLAAGRKAERQMAHYLRRAFGDAADILVINGLRLEHRGEIAQIDHLVLGQFGFIVIESKSVTTEIAINEAGDWSRLWQGRREGMPSPLHQGERQRDLLIKLVDERRPLKNRLGMKRSLAQVKSDVLAAISDGGIIHRPARYPTDRVIKADQAAQAIRTLFSRFQKEAEKLWTLEMTPTFTLSTLQEVAELLVEVHTPLHRPGSAGVPPAVGQRPALQDQPQAGGLTCRACGGGAVTILHGRFGYYGKCRDCDSNTPIKTGCGRDDCGQRVRKQGPLFLRDCGTCDSQRPFHENVAA